MRHAWPALLLAVPAVAHAHHPADHPATVATRVAVALRTTSFQLEGQAGRYETLSAHGEWAAHPRVSLGLGVPVHLLSVDGRDLVAGPGDIALRGKLQLVHSDDLSLCLHAGVELPTGSAHDQLGSGHVEAAAGVAAASTIGRTILGASVTYVQAFAGHHHDDPVLIDPHEDRQVELAVTGALAFERWFAGVVGKLEIPAVADRQVRAVAGATVGLLQGAWAWRLLFEGGMGAERPFDLRLLAAVEWEL